MPVDNELYDRMADTWWDEQGFLYGLKATNPVRFGYMKKVLLEELGIAPAGGKTLNIGCGLLAEEFARMGYDVTGMDPSETSLEAAREHAAREGLTIAYHPGEGERLPFEDGTFDFAYCCDAGACERSAAGDCRDGTCPWRITNSTNLNGFEFSGGTNPFSRLENRTIWSIIPPLHFT